MSGKSGTRGLRIWKFWPEITAYTVMMSILSLLATVGPCANMTLQMKKKLNMNTISKQSIKSTGNLNLLPNGVIPTYRDKEVVKMG